MQQSSILLSSSLENNIFFKCGFKHWCRLVSRTKKKEGDVVLIAFAKKHLRANSHKVKTKKKQHQQKNSVQTNAQLDRFIIAIQILASVFANGKFNLNSFEHVAEEKF